MAHQQHFSEMDDAHLQLWQKRYFQINNNNHDMHLNADCIRGFMEQISISEKTKSFSSNAAAVLLTDYGVEYAGVMDTKEGTDNYSSEALHLCRFRQSADSKWKSSLDPKNLSSIPFVKEYLLRQQTASDTAEEGKFMNDLRQSYSSSEKKDFFGTSLSPVKKCSETLPDQRRSTPLEKKNPSMPDTNSATPPPSWRLNGQQNAKFDQGQSKRPTSQAVFKNGSTSGWTKEERGNSAWSGEGGGKRKWSSNRQAEPAAHKRSKEPGNTFFRTAGEQLSLDSAKTQRYDGGVANRRSLGSRGAQLYGRFVSPVAGRENVESNERKPKLEEEIVNVDPRLVNIDPQMIERIRNEIMDNGTPVKWDDIAGLEFAKKTIKEIVVLPMLRPDIFTGLRSPAKGLLLFGPPGTGKTLIGKCIACQAKATFFSISASTLTSKWVGEGEKMVRALFAVARCHQPAVIFIDEIDSLLNQRSDSEHESSRRMKTEFLVQLDGATTDQESERILVVGATNRPHELDEAARRRLSKRLYIPLPEQEARVRIMKNLLTSQPHNVAEEHFQEIGRLTEGYSGADMANLCRDAALGPTRQVSVEDIEWIPANEVGPILYEHFVGGLSLVKASVSERDLQVYLDFNLKYGCTPI